MSAFSFGKQFDAYERRLYVCDKNYVYFEGTCCICLQGTNLILVLKSVR